MVKNMSDTDYKELDYSGLSLCAFADGGCKPQPGNGGSGVHGYFWKEKESKQGNGHPTHILTNKGYILKADYKEIEKDPSSEIREIEVVSYIEIIQTIPNATNNRAELLAFTLVLEKAAELKVQHVNIFADSQYTIDRYLKLEAGKAHNWKSNGEFVKNWDLLERMYHAKEATKTHGIEVEITKIAGHSGDPGNDAADLLASIAVALTANEVSRYECDIIDAKGYWKNDVNRHPFLQSNAIYFNTDPSTNINGTYLLGSHGNEVELLGTRMTEGSYSLVQIDGGEPTLEYLRSTALSKSKAFGEHCLMLADLSKVFNGKAFKLINEYEDKILLQKPGDQSLYLLSTRTDAVLVQAISPPRLAWRVFDCFNELDQIYEHAKANSKKIALTDITDIFYEYTEKKKKNETIKECVLKTKFKVGYKQEPVVANFIDPDGKTLQNKVSLILGVDLLHRNALKNIESLEPKLELVTWAESEKVFRYAVIIHVTGARGIWAGMYSNYVFITEQK